MDQSLIKRCPRCGQSFECRSRAVAPCACMQVRLSQAASASIRRDYQDCLCVNCLRELNRITPGAEDPVGGHSPEQD